MASTLVLRPRVSAWDVRGNVARFAIMEALEPFTVVESSNYHSDCLADTSILAKAVHGARRNKGLPSFQISQFQAVWLF